MKPVFLTVQSFQFEVGTYYTGASILSLCHQDLFPKSQWMSSLSIRRVKLYMSTNVLLQRLMHCMVICIPGLV